MPKDITEQLIDVVRSAVTPLQFTPPKPVSFGKEKGDEEQAVLMLSDWHLGEKNSKYNLRIARQRIERLMNSTMLITALHRKVYPVKILNIFWLGDIVSGESIFPSQPHEIEVGVVDQIFQSVPCVVEQLARLCGFFQEVRCTTVNGNHGRLGKFANKLSNFDRVFYETMRAATTGIPNLNWDITPDWHFQTRVLSTRFLGIHGSQIKIHLNLPWYGLTTRAGRWAITEGLGGFDIMVLGHFHSSSRIRWNNKIILTNGTLVDGDEFALEKMGLESSQCQWFFGVHPRQGLTWSYEIHLNKVR